MAGISDQALQFGKYNRYRYNGIELDTSLGLDDYEAKLRNLDPQTGRWWQVDPQAEKTEFLSPYASNDNDPIRLSDPNGDVAGCCDGVGDALKQAVVNTVLFTAGALNAFVTDHTGGAGRADPTTMKDLSPSSQQVVLAGQTFGDAGAIVAGGGEATGSAAAGVASDGALAVPAVAGVAYGFNTATVATINLVKDFQKLDASGNGTQNPKVKEAVQQGKDAHADFKDKTDAKPGWQSNPRLTDPQTGKTVIPDALSPSGKPVELKPNTPTGKAQGARQLVKYERATGQKGRVVYYTPKPDTE